MRISLTRLMAGFALALLAALGTTAFAGVPGESASSDSQSARGMVGMAERSAVSGLIYPGHARGVRAGMATTSPGFDKDLPFGIERTTTSFSSTSGWIRFSAGSARIRTMYAFSETCVTGDEYRTGVSIAKGFERLYASAWRDVA